MAPHPDQDFAGKPGDGDRRHTSGINPLSGVDMTRLRESMSWSAKMMSPFRKNHESAVKFYAGSRYGNNTDLDKTAINMVKLAVGIWRRQLAAQTPKALVITRNPSAKTDAYELEMGIDHLLKTIRFGDRLGDCVLNAIFSMGIMKVGISDQNVSLSSGFTKEAGQPYADPILFEDWLHDMNARNIEEWDWCGNRYRIPYEDVMENPDFDRAAKDMLEPKEMGSTAYGDAFGADYENTASLSSENTVIKTEYRQHVDLWDLWIPGDNLLVTMPAQDGVMPLQVREWEGPEHGPFHLMSFTNVPGNLIPAAPVQQLVDLQDLMTRLFNQLARQAERQKTLTVVDGRAESDGTGEAIMEGEDGQVIKTAHIDGVKEMKYGGIDQGNMAFVVWLRETFSYLGGNLDAMGGLAQQAETLGQERIISQSSNEMIRDMQTKVVEFSGRVIGDLAWYLYTDPVIELPLAKRIEGFGDVPFSYGPEDRTMDFFNFQFKIEPYSLQNKGPQERLQTIMGLMNSLFVPLAPQMSEWGMTMNFQKLIELISKYTDLPEINEIIESESATMAEMMGMAESAQEGAGGSDKPRQSPSTQRNYTRENVSTGGTAANRSNQLVQSLMKNAGGQQ